MAIELDKLAPGLWRTLFHIGVVVPDIDAAMRELGEQFGIEFDPPKLFSASMRFGPDEERRRTVMYSYSRQGPPFLELVQAMPSSIWTPEGGARMHHVGVRTPDVAKEAERLQRLGYRLEVIGGPDVTPNAFAYLVNEWGVRVELCIDRGGGTAHRGDA